MSRHRSPRHRSLAEKLESRILFASLPRGFQEIHVARVNTDVATSMAFAPDGRLFVSDNRTGDIEIVQNGQDVSTFAHVDVDTYRERGLESIVLDPNFAKNGYVYAYYTHADPSNPNTAPNGAKEYLSRFKASATNPNVADPTFGEQVLLSGINSTTGVHNGGMMRFGPDGMLYLAIGDSDVTSNAQNLGSDNGKVLRLDVENYPNIIPSDNPFVHTPGAKPEIYAYGFRNPFTGDIDPDTGQIMVNDVGESTWEEVDNVQAGKNYGWPQAEGAVNKPGLTDPIYEYHHTADTATTATGNNSAITGGVFYEGNMFPAAYKGKYFFADYLNKWIRMIDPTTGKETDFETNGPQILNLAVNPIDGSMYALEIGGNIYKIIYNGNTDDQIPTAVATSNVVSGTLPLKVNFDGSGSSDPDNDKLTYAWDFGDGTTGTGKTVSHTYTTAGQFTVNMTVNDGRGGIDAIDQPIVIFAGDRAPVPVITLPKTGATYAAGNTISFAGSATDPEDGTLPASDYNWSIVFHHEMHTHPFLDSIPDVKSGTFQIPVTGEVDPVQWYRVTLTVTDSQGLSVSTFTDVDPLTSTFTLASNVVGATLTLDGAPEQAPESTKGVVGMTRVIGAPASFKLNGHSYQFVSWSDGGAATHTISTPTKNTTFTAVFKDVSASSSITLKPTADSYVQDGSNAGANFGTSKTLLVKKSSTTGTNRVTYLKFDLSSVSSIGSAVLQLYGDESAAGSIQVAAYQSSNTSWSETGITFNNAPASTGSALATMTLSSQTNGTHDLDLTSFLQAQKNAGHNTVSIMLKGTANTSPLAQFNSRESSSNQPELVISPASANSKTLNATADAYVRSGSFATTNYGSANILDVKLGTGDYIRQTYLKFDLSSISTINSAKLRLWGSLADVTATNIETDVYGASDTSWSESTIDYANRPAITGSKLASAVVANALNAWYQFDVTAYLKAQKAAGKTSVTLVLKNAATAAPATVFNSKEATTNRPELVIS